MRTDWKSATVAKLCTVSSRFAEHVYRIREKQGRSYTREDRSWKCVGTHGTEQRDRAVPARVWSAGYGRSCPACSRSVRMFFVPEDTKTLRAGWYIEKAGATHPRAQAQAQGVSWLEHREAERYPCDVGAVGRLCAQPDR